MSAHDVICFKSIGGMNVGGWRHWLDRTALEGDIRLLAPVGPPTSPAPPGAVGIARAIQLTAEHPAGFGAGSVLIAERNGTENAELRRLLAKQAAGCGWFISQTVYDAPRTIGLLRLYGRECRRLGIRPRRIVLSFAPCGGPRTLAFMHWLGIAVPAGIRAMLGSSSTPLTDSIEVCRSSLCQVLDSVGDLPLGFCVESLSSRQAEFEASIDLFAALGDVLWQHGHRRSSTAISALASA